jgi:hypothetical protein
LSSEPTSETVNMFTHLVNSLDEESVLPWVPTDVREYSHRKKADLHASSEWDSNRRFHCSSCPTGVSFEFRNITVSSGKNYE